MPRQTAMLYALVALMLLSACAPAPTATRVPTSRPRITVVPSLTLAVTETPAATPLPPTCPAGYSLYTDAGMGFAACYPEGWLVSKQEDPQAELARVTFNPPEGSRGAGLRLITVSTTPTLPSFTDEEFLQEIDNWLQQEYYQRLLTQPQIVLLDQHRAVDAAYEARVVLGREVVDVTRWVTALRAHDQRWFIEIAGRTQYREELERIRAQLLAYFQIAAS